MRVLYSHRVQSHDGQSVHIEELINGFRQAGHQVLVIGPSFYDKVGFGGESRLIANARRMLPRHVAEIVEIVYSIYVFFRLKRAHDQFRSDFIYERYNLYYLAGMLLKRWYKVPFYLEVNSPIAEERTRYGGLKLRWLARGFERLVWKSADRIFVVTAVLSDIVADAGVSRERITVIPNGVVLNSFSREPYEPRACGPVIIGFVGFVREWHGLGDVLAGLAADNANSAIHLVIGGPVYPDLEEQAQKLGVADQIRFLGLQQRDAIPNLLRTFDIALQPQAVRYASPLKLFEYMAAGRAIVAPNQPNIREILTHGENAILFDPKEPGALWRAVQDLAANPGLRERLGHAARRTLEKRDYTWLGNAIRITEAVSADRASHDAGVNAELPLGRSLRPGAQ